MIKTYFLAPFVGWIVAGSIKFILSSMRARTLSWESLGYGGMPSTHTCVVVTTASMVGFGEGFTSPLFAVALTLALVVIIDAIDLRRLIGLQAAAINRYLQDATINDHKPLRERMGHSFAEVSVGALLGILLGWALFYLSTY